MDQKHEPHVDDLYAKLIQLLDRQKARYRLIDHSPEGRTEIVSPMRGNALSQAAKCIVIMVKIRKKETKYVLAVVPGDAKVHLDAVKALFNGTYISFASKEIAEELAGSVAGITERATLPANALTPAQLATPPTQQ